MNIDTDFENKWKALLNQLSDSYGEELDIQAVIFIIGLQELNKNHRKYSKDQKIDIMHIAICSLLSKYGYYEFVGRDEEGWPHFNATDKLPHLKAGQQLRLMKEAIMEYFT